MAGIGASLAAGVSSQAQARTVANFTGIVDVILNISIGGLSPVRSGHEVICTATITVNDAAETYSDSATGVATLQGAFNASCLLTIPYLWPLGTPADDHVSVSYSVAVLPAGTITNSSNPNTRSASGFNVASFLVPANSATKSLPFPTKI